MRTYISHFKFNKPDLIFQFSIEDLVELSHQNNEQKKLIFSNYDEMQWVIYIEEIIDNRGLTLTIIQEMLSLTLC